MASMTLVALSLPQRTLSVIVAVGEAKGLLRSHQHPTPAADKAYFTACLLTTTRLHSVELWETVKYA